MGELAAAMKAALDSDVPSGALSSQPGQDPFASSPRGPRQVERAKVPFRTKLTFFAALLTIVPLSVVGLLVIRDATRTVERLNREYRAQVVGNIEAMLEAELQGAQDGLDLVGRTITDPAIDEALVEPLAADMVAAWESLDHVGVYDVRGGRVALIQEPGTALEPPADLPAEVMAEAEGQGVGTGHTVDDPGHAPRVLLAVPLRALRPGTSAPQLSGYAASYVSLEPVQRRVEELASSDFEGDDVFVADGEGRLVVHLERARASVRDAAPELDQLVGPDARSEMRDYVGVGPNVNAAGEPTISTAFWSHRRRFTIVVQVPEEKAYRAPREMRAVILVVVGAAIALALIAAFVVARQVTQPIRQLSRFAKDLAARRWDKRVTLRTLDEFGVLGDVMSNAAADLQASERRIRREEAIRGDLGRYLPAEIVDKVVKREQDMQLGGSRREVSVLFADVVAFTPLTDQLGAEQIVGLLNELFTVLTEVVFRHGGTIDKFIGDCVMAVWGAATPADDHADRALAAAEDMLRFVEVGNEGWFAKYGVRIELAIGVNSGPAIVGNIGSESRMEYTAIGDTVNVAARLEAIARPSQILATLATKNLSDGGYDFVDLGEREMTGRAEPVHVFEVRL
ncbi:MAG: adenylate/guanylate cyclase domain-containing protein [Sandaracinaceae bacterium]|nr:adenylate/guanylate cyclase domain-containing protein [Sandaracinaceae bacterium]